MGIPLGSNFDVNTALPLDSRLKVADSTARDAIDSLKRYEGMLVYVVADAKNYQLIGGITNSHWQELSGSGGGNGSINFIQNGNAEDQTINNFITYNDGATSRPIDGTGGTPTITNVSRSIASPILYQNASWRFVKPASNVQGQGWSVPFTVQDGFMSKAIKIRFLYKAVTGTFTAGSLSADSDLIVYLYDVTNSKLIEPTNFKLFSNSSTISDIFEGEFQTSATGTSYRLIFHIASNTTNAWTLAVDEIQVSPSEYVFGTPIGDWQAWTPTGSWTNVTYTGWKRRVGDTYEYQVNLTATGVPASGSLLINIQETMDLSKMVTAGPKYLGGGLAHDVGTNEYEVLVHYNSPTQMLVRYTQSTTPPNPVTMPAVTPTAPFSWVSGDTLNIRFSAPVVGLSSSTRMSDGYDGRVVAFDIYKSTTQSIPNASETKVVFGAIMFDDVGGWDSVNNRYIVRTAGKYGVKALLSYTGNAAGVREVQIKINGATRVRVQQLTNGSGYDTGVLGSRNFDLVAGDFIEVFAYQDSGGALNLEAGTQWTYFSIEKINGSTAISASENVSLKYENTAGTIITSTTAIVPFPTKVYDTHNAYNTSTGVFTAPIQGDYEIISNMLTNAVANTTTQQFQAFVLVTSTPEGLSAQSQLSSVVNGNGASVVQPGLVSRTYRLNAGDTLAIQAANSNTIALNSTAGRNILMIKKG